MATATLPPNAVASAYVWNTPNIQHNFAPINYTVANTVERISINTNVESLAAVREILAEINSFIAIGLEQVKQNYKLAKKYLKYVIGIKQMCIGIIEAIDGIIELNKLQIKDANMISFMNTIKQAYAESDYAYEALMVFKGLDECEKAPGNTYTMNQFKTKFGIA